MADKRCKLRLRVIAYAHSYWFHQIVYISIIGPLMFAAALEWILWLAAFLYCLCKVYQKADHWSIKLLAVIMTILFALLR